MKNHFLTLLFILINITISLCQNYQYKNVSILYSSNDSIIISNKALKFPSEVTIIPDEAKMDILSYRKGLYKSVIDKTKNSKARLHVQKSEVTYEFQANSIKDNEGVDLLFFFEKSIPNTEVFVSKNRSDWISCGWINNQKPFIDLVDINQEKFTFLKFRIDTITILNKIALNYSKLGKLGIENKINGNTIYTKSEYIYLQLYDYRLFDLDRVRTSLNDKIIAKNRLLTKWNKFIKIKLKEGENILSIRALNEGFYKPNTINIKLVDGIKINIGDIRLKKNTNKSVRIVKVNEETQNLMSKHLR